MTSTVLDITQKQEVSYCIPDWLRDEQIKIAISKVRGRIKPVIELRTDPIAVVCFGSSLNDTIEEIRKFKFIISCSGSHKFLIEHGIIPTWHVEVDPRKHKVELLGQPRKDVEYLIASTCHPKYFDHLAGMNVKLWHVFANDQEAIRALPRGEWAVTGGCSVGLRAMTMARFLGFTNLHIFGMDGCEGKTGKHASAHPMQPKDHSITVYEGIEYRTTASMLEAARQTWHELDQMPDVKATFYGEGLVQAMAKNYKPNPVEKEKSVLGFEKPELISAEYRDLNAKLHKENLAYGVGGGKYKDSILKMAENMKTNSILDYGCGKGYLAKQIPFPIWEYDPAIPGKDESPRPADIVVCTDVLEHIEPDKINLVLDDLRRCTKQVGYFVIHTGPSTKNLPDGRNAHILQKDKAWWNNLLGRFFSVAKILESGMLLHIIVAPKQMKKKA